MSASGANNRQVDAGFVRLWERVLVAMADGHEGRGITYDGKAVDVIEADLHLRKLRAGLRRG